jgi:argininosuccinate lyase
VLVDAAKKYDKVILPGYTHMQHAQPVLLSHHLLAYSWMFARDFTRLKAAFAEQIAASQKVLDKS